MDELQRSALISQWWQALSAICAVSMSAREAQGLLGSLVDEFAGALDADPFDTAAGERVGRALVTMDFVDPGVATVSAQILWRLAEHSGRADANRRMAALLTAVGQGHQGQLYQVRSSASENALSAAEEARRAADERFRIVFDNAAIGIGIGDTDGTLHDANRCLADMIGVPVEALRGVRVLRYAHPEDVDDIGALIFDKLVPARAGTVKFERRAIRPDGSIGWAAFSVTYVQGSGGQADYLLSVGEDVTERHRLEEELHWQARHDPLTGLPNRRHLLERIQLISTAADADDRVGLCFVDLDRFKEINDRYGHGIGDQVLVVVATRLRDSLSRDDCMIARIGGDEFVALVFPPADDRGVTAVAEALLSALATPITVGGHRLPVSASLGAVVATVADTRAEALLDAADRALYHAKTSGKDQWVLHLFEPHTGG
jgi:diguanylate cyclase (GGDEF)-like protein/PAS domain S-box-containing protein